MRRTALLGRLLVLGALGGGAALAHLAYAPLGDTAPHPFNHDRNAVWLEHRWLERRHSDGEMEALFVRLRARGIAYVYPHVIPFDDAGRLPPHDREQMRAFLAAARRIAPELRVLPWIGGLRRGYRRQRPGTIELADLTQRQRIVAEARGLVDEGFDGVHVNVEPGEQRLHLGVGMPPLEPAVLEPHRVAVVVEGMGCRVPHRGVREVGDRCRAGHGQQQGEPREKGDPAHRSSRTSRTRAAA